MTATSVQAPPSLQDATARSTAAWQSDLEALFHHAKDRFPDVVWRVIDEEDEDAVPEQVWGHKAIVYARAPPSFQNRYFTARPNVISPNPYSTPTGVPLNSALSLPLSMEYDASRESSPFRSGSPSPSTNINGVMQLTTSINPGLFSNQLEYLYTGKGFGEAFEFLFDSTESHDDGDAEEQRVDKLRKDLVFMWRSRLYSDIRITLTGTYSSSGNHENSQAIFSTHRFILVSRSPYFYNALTAWGLQQPQGKTSEVTLPSPPFTPPALHFILGFIYTGTLVFSHRTYDLDTSFYILRCATYLSLQTLYDEVQARIVQEMMHGLFHAFLEFSEYERITNGKWGTGGCRCRQCARRAPRILEFSLLDDVKNPHLERGARRALVGLFGEGWCNSEFAHLDQKHRDYVLRGLTKRMTPENIFPLLFASSHALSKLGTVIDPWGNISRDMINNAVKNMDSALCDHAEECFEQPEWLELMDQEDGVGFDDGEKVQLIMESVKRGLTERNAPMVYQVLVSSILLRPHPTEVDAAMLPATSHVRVQVEETRTEVLRWIGRRWMNIRQEGGFDELEGWAIKEISNELDIPVDDLFSPPEYKSGKTFRSEGQSDVASVHSLHSVVAKKRIVTPTKGQSSGASIRSMARSTISNHTVKTGVSRSTAGNLNRRPATHKHVSRPDSKLTSPSQVQLPPSRPGSAEPDEKPSDKPIPKTLVTPLARQGSVISSKSSVHSNVTNGRPRSSAPSLSPSIKSNNTVRTTNNSLRPRVSSAPRSPSMASNSTSDTSTAYKTAGASSAGLRPPSGVSRTASGASSDGTGTFKTASAGLQSPGSRDRKLSSASTASNTSFKSTGTATAKAGLRSSTVSTASMRSSPNKPRHSAVSQSAKKLSPTAKPKTPSLYSVRSTVSTKSAASKPKSPLTKTVPIPEREKKSPLTETSNASRIANAAKGKSKEVDDTSAGSSTASSSTAGGQTVKRKGSADTITKRHVKKDAPPSTAEPAPLKESLPTSAQGATLEIGIPCIISLKRKRFKAFARYIGEVEGELGPWVGVEVPMGEDMLDGNLDSRQWNDGSWGGIRYFDIGGVGSEWEFGDDRPSRRRRLDAISGSSGLKREGDALSLHRQKRFRSVSPALSDVSVTESRGLFVRPQNVLFVMGAD